MPGFTPARRWQPPYSPFKREKFSRRLLASVERVVKGPMFGCRMCGNCGKTCPKGLPVAELMRVRMYHDEDGLPDHARDEFADAL